ncbi:hypothetical protein [Flavobacterium aquatile]|uniref:Uncharacterized protein n=1 Tax=Flavobacterium aquatile LMG 4008 = ATCC 11947 TaxID=1453498 RepID=A0A095TX13_9FLAO|nr:hypothetical protein [Flavobacterium aquatile]KGD66923.1 hypothetical protein LG45_15980 [Flavobacterium aquatile LMG 4008 = ATCC 11947]OXA68016.1 hypothetical protein B0A61_05990 [Flavobacterium aquatile LMG 4008 = ATCC 11947]GEC80136.1 hypothetical protein FAQ01_30060 [Flavobacterium aquatile]
MKQELITISSAVAVGALSRGLTGTVTETSSNMVKGVVNGAVAFGAGFLAVKVKGSDTKSSLLRGSAIGVSIAHGLELVKNVFSSEKIASKLNPETTMGRFMQKAAGLSGAVNGLNGYIDAYGNYHEDGLGGYIDVNGNYVEDGLSGYDDEEGLNGYYDEAGNYHEDGLGGYIDASGNYVEDGLSAYEDEDGLGAYIDENGNYIL